MCCLLAEPIPLSFQAHHPTSTSLNNRGGALYHSLHFPVPSLPVSLGGLCVFEEKRWRTRGWGLDGGGTWNRGGRGNFTWNIKKKTLTNKNSIKRGKHPVRRISEGPCSQTIEVVVIALVAFQREKRYDPIDEDKHILWT